MVILSRSGGGDIPHFSALISFYCVLLSALTYAHSPTTLDHTSHHISQGESSWDAPEGWISNKADAVGGGKWEKHWDEDSKTYYYVDESTGESR